MKFKHLEIIWDTVNNDIDVKGEAITSESDLNGRILKVEVKNLEKIDNYELNLYWESTVKNIASLDAFNKTGNGIYEIILPQSLNAQGNDVRCILQLANKNKIELMHSKPFILKVVKGINDRQLNLTPEFTTIQKIIIETIELKEEVEEIFEKFSDLESFRGPKGPKGDTGARGPEGPKGERGPEGPQGERGPEGPKGDKGDTGARGPEGPKGEIGPEGPKGEIGPEGPKGERGPEGLPGRDAVVESGKQNGTNYVKYSDGTIIQWNAHYEEDIPVKTVNGPLYRSGNIIWELPIKMVSETTIFASSKHWMTWSQAFGIDGNGTTVKIIQHSPQEIETATPMYLMAIGKWK